MLILHQKLKIGPLHFLFVSLCTNKQLVVLPNINGVFPIKHIIMYVLIFLGLDTSHSYFASTVVIGSSVCTGNMHGRWSFIGGPWAGHVTVLQCWLRDFQDSCKGHLLPVSVTDTVYLSRSFCSSFEIITKNPRTRIMVSFVSCYSFLLLGI